MSRELAWKLYEELKNVEHGNEFQCIPAILSFYGNGNTLPCVLHSHVHALPTRAQTFQRHCNMLAEKLK